MSVKDIVNTWDIEEQLLDDSIIQMKNLESGIDLYYIK